jgi:hypothetical protein
VEIGCFLLKFCEEKDLKMQKEMRVLFFGNQNLLFCGVLKVDMWRRVWTFDWYATHMGKIFKLMQKNFGYLLCFWKFLVTGIWFFCGGL